MSTLLLMQGFSSRIVTRVGFVQLWPKVMSRGYTLSVEHVLLLSPRVRLNHQNTIVWYKMDKHSI